METPTQDSGTRLDRIRAGDRVALAAAFGSYRERLQRAARFRLDPRLRGRVDPEDLLQEAYLNAEQRCRHLEGDTELSLFVWLRLILMQTLVDVHRRHLGARQRDAGREVARHAPAPGASTSHSLVAGLIGDWTSPSMALQRAERAEQLRTALEQMDGIDCEVVALRHFEELSNREVAAVLGIEQKAASIRYIRALRRLRGFVGTATDTTSLPPGA